MFSFVELRSRFEVDVELRSSASKQYIPDVTRYDQETTTRDAMYICSCVLQPTGIFLLRKFFLRPLFEYKISLVV